VNILVASHKHHLLPFAWRLKREGHSVEVVVVKDRYEKAWEPLLPKVLSGKEKGAAGWQPWVDRAKGGELVVVTDSPKVGALFKDAQFRFGPGTAKWDEPPTMLLGWWSSGTAELKPSLLHWLVVDWGIWPLGLGPSLPGAVALLRANHDNDQVVELLTQVQEEPGLNYLGVRWEPVSKEFQKIGHTSGWPFLLTHAFVSNLSNLGQMLEKGGQDAAGIEEPFVVALPVSVSPWPVETHLPAPQLPVAGIDDADMRDIFFHDMTVESGRVFTDGLDGLLGVVRGAHRWPSVALTRAMGLAGRIQVPGKQYRPDALRALVPLAEQLEARGLLR
jgi:hypothetical protein